MDVGPLVRAFAAGAPIFAINFHNTPQYRAAAYDRELGQLAQWFAPATEDSLAAFLATGRWPHAKPGVVIALYNGYRNNFDVFRPLLERHGLRGWFFVASGYVDCPVPEQLAFAAAHTLATIPDEYSDGRYALSWDEIRALDRAGHVIASHTRTHSRVSEGEAVALEAEILGSQEDFRRELGRPVRAFAWLMGAPYGENPLADRLVDRAGYEFLFSNFRVQRLPRLSRAA